MEIKIPHNYDPRPYQLEYLKAKERFKILVLHRRAGKSKTALNEQIRKAVLTKGVYYYILPTYKQAKTVIWDELVKTHVPSELVEKVNDSELSIYWKNGSIQRFVGCEDPDKHRGINPIDVVFDEYSEMKESIWTDIIQPVLRENKGTATFIFTPKGQNHAWKLLQMAKGDGDWWTSIKTVNDTRAIEEEEIEKAKKGMPQAMFQQEFMCEFLEGAGQFFKRIRENVHNEVIQPEFGFNYQLGVDLAKYQDWTVLTPFSLNSFKVGQQDRFNQVDWNLQKAKIGNECRRWNNARIIIDSTGVGDPITEDLQREGLPIEPYKFTEISRRQLLDNLAILLEQDKIKIPNDEGLIDELLSFRYELTEQGKIKVSVPENMTDDRVMSLALAVWQAKEAIGEKEIKAKEDFNLYITEYN